MDHSKKRKSVRNNYLLRIVHNIVDCFCHEFFSEFIPVKSSPNPLRLPFDDVSRLIPYERHPNYGSGVVHRFLGAQEPAVGDEHLHVLVSCEMNIAMKFGMINFFLKNAKSSMLHCIQKLRHISVIPKGFIVLQTIPYI